MIILLHRFRGRRWLCLHQPLFPDQQLRGCLCRSRGLLQRALSDGKLQQQLNCFVETEGQTAL